MVNQNPCRCGTYVNPSFRELSLSDRRFSFMHHCGSDEAGGMKTSTKLYGVNWLYATYLVDFVYISSV